MLLWLASGLLAGIRHAFEPDHVAAVSALLARERDTRSAIRLGAAWGVGHALMIALVFAAVALGASSFPAALTEWPDRVVGGALVLLGFLAVHNAVSNRLHLHFHRHDGGTHAHFHLHGPARGHVHGHPGHFVTAGRGLGIGMLHGLAGSGLLVATAWAMAPSPIERWGTLLLYSLGSLGAMTVMTFVLGRTLGSVPAGAGRVLRIVSGAASITVGIVFLA